jgi:hypothetical protein
MIGHDACLRRKFNFNTWFDSQINDMEQECICTIIHIRTQYVWESIISLMLTNITRTTIIKYLEVC